MFRSLNGALLQTVAFGGGPRTIVAHGGWTGSWELWQEPFELMSRSWRCIGYDHRGSGESAVAPDAITFEAMLADLWAVMDAYEVDRCVLAAESMGCIVAMAAAAQRPERFDGLVLVSARRVITAATAAPLVAGSRRDYPSTVSAFVDACLPEPDVEHLARRGRSLLLKAEPEAAARILEACYDVTPDVGRITVPTVLIHGSHDRIVPLAEARSLQAALPHATLRVLEGIGHVPTMTATADVVAIIEETFPATPETCPTCGAVAPGGACPRSGVD